MSRQSITNNYFPIISSPMIHKSVACDQLLGDQSSDIFHLILVSFKPYSFRHVLIQSCACVSLWPLQVSSREYVKSSEDDMMRTYAAAPLLMLHLATLCPLNALAPCLNLCSMLQHMATLRRLSICSQQLISASLEVRTCHLSKKKKKKS